MLSSYRSLVLSVAPATEIMTTAQAKSHLRVLHSDDDTDIDLMVEVARRHIEARTGQQLINATWVMKMDSFPGSYGEIVMPRYPLSSVTSLAYVDANGDSQTLTETTHYVVDASSKPGRIYLPYNVSWPTTYGQPNDVTITFVAGYGTAATSVPQELIRAAKLIVGHLYEDREQFSRDREAYEFPTVDRLLINERAEYTF